MQIKRTRGEPGGWLPGQVCHFSWMLFLSVKIAVGETLPPAFPLDPRQYLERTCFQTGQSWSPKGNLRSDVAIVYGIDLGLAQRIQTWRDRGYRIHVMTGVSWGNYQDYLYGRFDGRNHEDEAQTDRHGEKISHGGDVYYMSPGENFGKFLCLGVQRALDAGAEAIHLEEPEFWVRGGYSEGFKREWRARYGEAWEAPHSSVDAQWRASRLKYELYRRALQQVFDHVRDYNRRTGRSVRCYVPTHSLLNYAHWRIVSPESSLAQLEGCDGYIGQVWTGTARTPNVYRGKLKERTFETAFLEYGAMQNLVRSTGRTVWYLNDPIEDNPRHDWEDYRVNWESTMVASLLQPDVWRFEVAPWPERVFSGRYPSGRPESKPIPAGYATEIQAVCHSLNDMKQDAVSWECGTPGLGVLISDTLMFQRGDPSPSDRHLGHFYGLALPLLKRGMPVSPVQLENVVKPGYLREFRVLVLTYQGMKPMTPGVHQALATWVRAGGALVLCDDDSDPYNLVREWWNTGGLDYLTPREHLVELLRGHRKGEGGVVNDGDWVTSGAGGWIWLRKNPAELAGSADGDEQVRRAVRVAASRVGVEWHESDHLVLRRGPYVVAAGLDESLPVEPRVLGGRFVNLFDPELGLVRDPRLVQHSRWLLVDLNLVEKTAPKVLASACKALPVTVEDDPETWKLVIEGVGGTPGVVLAKVPRRPDKVFLSDKGNVSVHYDDEEHLAWFRFENEAFPREISVVF